MMNIAQIRQQYPQYDDMSDEQLTSAIQKKFGRLPEPQLSPLQQAFAQNPFGGNSTIGAFAGGLLSGVNDVGRGAKQLLTKAGEFTGLLPQGAEQQYTQQTDKERALERGLLSGLFPQDEMAASAGNIAGGVAPYALIPGLGLASLPARIGVGAATGAAIGGSQYVPEGDSRASNMEIGGVLGGGLPIAGGLLSGVAKPLAGGAVDLIKKGAKNLFPDRFEGLIAKDLMTGIDAKAALKAKKEAEKLGINLTPAEASGSETVKNAQRALGASKEGQEKLSSFMRERGQQEKNIINKTMRDISPNKQDASGEIREAAKNVIKKEMENRKAVSRPFYEASQDTIIPKNDLTSLYNKYPVIKDAYKDVLKDKAYASEIKGLSPSSIKIADLAKRNLDDKIEKFTRAGEMNKARLYKKAKNELVEVADNASPVYKVARGMYEEGSRSLQKLTGSDIKRIADLPDYQLQQVSKILFDRNETNPKVLGKLRDTFMKENPGAWRQIVRNEMDRRLSHMEHGTTGSKFYNAILKKDADFNQFLIATKGMPDVQKNLIAMRPVFKNLINNIRDKNIIAAESAVQSLPKEAGKAASKALMSRYDKKAIEIITSGKWDKYLENINKTKDKKEKTLKLGKLLGMKVNLNAATTAAATSPRREK